MRPRHRPLRLAPFEHYMLADDRPSHPMSFFLRFTIAGAFDRARLRVAISETARLHPLFGATVRPQGKSWQWLPGTAEPTLREHRFGRFFAGPIQASDRGGGGGGLTAEDQLTAWSIDLRTEAGIRLSVADPRLTPSGSEHQAAELWIQIHHACADARGVLQFVSDLATAMSDDLGRAGPPGRDHGTLIDCSNSAVKPTAESDGAAVSGGRVAALADRAIKTPPRRWCYLWITSPQWKRILAFYGHPTRPVALVRQPHRRSVYAPMTVSGTVVLDHAKWTRRRQRLGYDATLNDVFIAALFHVLAGALIRFGTPARHWYRLAMPIDQRECDSTPASACNRTSMVYLDRRLKDCIDIEALLADISGETARVKKHRLGDVLSDVLGWFDRIPNGIPIAVADRRAVVSTVLSNLGKVQPLQAGGGELTPTQFVVPRRPGTNLAVGVVTVDDKIQFCVHYDQNFIPQEAAEQIAAGICQQVADFCGEAAEVSGAEPALTAALA